MTVAIDIFRILAACTSTMMLLSPIPMIYNVYKTKSTGVASIVPLVSMFANSHIAIFYGYLSKHYFPIFSTFVVGDLLSLTYIIIFFTYSPERRKNIRVLIICGIPLALITIYGFIGGYGVGGLTRHDAGRNIAYVSVLTNLLLYSAPFEKISMVLQHRSAVFINIHMVAVGTCNNATWITYTSMTQQWIIFSPNVFCCCMGCVQICLYLVFHPSTHPYHGPMPGMPVTAQELDIELGQLALSPKSRAKSMKLDSPVFVPLSSPLEPPLAPLPPSK